MLRIHFCAALSELHWYTLCAQLFIGTTSAKLPNQDYACRCILLGTYRNPARLGHQKSRHIRKTHVAHSSGCDCCEQHGVHGYVNIFQKKIKYR